MHQRDCQNGISSCMSKWTIHAQFLYTKSETECNELNHKWWLNFVEAVCKEKFPKGHAQICFKIPPPIFLGH